MEFLVKQFGTLGLMAFGTGWLAVWARGKFDNMEKKLKACDEERTKLMLTFADLKEAHGELKGELKALKEHGSLRCMNFNRDD